MGHSLEATKGTGTADDEKSSAESVSELAAETAALRQRHADIELRLASLGRHPSLTTAEQQEWTRLKKEKLAGKDRLASLAARSKRAAAETPSRSD